ncbi:2'-5' RNA ligase family protein [uncultured Sphingomonas sp.]|uniref:2'-5' RNA ligase family protein n=1 Tax=uncultured Sphingomonas sp. TaxID=158754 RepID=UPI0025E31C41|nr:2'-5' RNA ligase family protein [uncultured Sphingomonas sp.]
MSALIVTAELGARDFAWLDGERRAYFPPERNQLSAHLTMFHALPPSAEGEVRRELARHVGGAPPRATVAGLMNLGRGVAYRIVSDELEAIRGSLADHFQGLLTAQDGQGWRPHVTVQNKVEAAEAKALLRSLEAAFRPRPLGISGLGLHRYLGGPWEALGRWSFRGA